MDKLSILGLNDNLQQDKQELFLPFSFFVVSRYSTISFLTAPLSRFVNKDILIYLKTGVSFYLQVNPSGD